MGTTISGSVTATSVSVRPLVNISERQPTSEVTLRRFGEKLTSDLRVAMPAAVVSYNALHQTIVAQPLIREKMVDRTTGDVVWMELPILQDVPVVFPQSGGYAFTMPISVGDEVLIIFGDQCIDSWWFSGSIQNWNIKRRHDLSDAFAIPGPRSVPNVIPNISTNATELRTIDGATKISLAPGVVNIIANTVNVDSPNINFNSNTEYTFSGASATFNVETFTVNTTNSITMESSGTMAMNTNTVAVNAILTHNGFNYLNHRHSGVQTGTSATAAVTE